MIITHEFQQDQAGDGESGNGKIIVQLPDGVISGQYSVSGGMGSGHESVENTTQIADEIAEAILDGISNSIGAGVWEVPDSDLPKLMNGTYDGSTATPREGGAKGEGTTGGTKGITRATKAISDGDTLDLWYFDNGQVFVGDEKGAALLTPKGNGYEVAQRWWREIPTIQGKEYSEYLDDNTVRVAEGSGREKDNEPETGGPSFANLAYHIIHQDEPLLPWMVKWIKDRAQ